MYIVIIYSKFMYIIIVYIYLYYMAHFKENKNTEIFYLDKVPKI